MAQWPRQCNQQADNQVMLTLDAKHTHFKIKFNQTHTHKQTTKVKILAGVMRQSGRQMAIRKGLMMMTMGNTYRPPKDHPPGRSVSCCTCQCARSVCHARRSTSFCIDRPWWRWWTSLLVWIHCHHRQDSSRWFSLFKQGKHTRRIVSQWRSQARRATINRTMNTVITIAVAVSVVVAG